eukprot:CAMPEP_0203678838 /NCGR_PEP_ID=MMETSP0090-20130426/33430_1 /ASSEMBLY_ACC=CAM_ASM_001088 /TAXON_ID=426623 /ORGANISM="Chaetoceros affinis, Strain CCMP159" /LENGTH=241 /DNA_ID=CAMNT_0050546251 /DNA_START=362 /DNA_END=1087 /DNA_ORIENTATION=-
MRAGVGNGRGANDIVFWTGEGELYESPSGKMVAKVDGVEVSKACYLNKDHVRVFSRKIFWYRDCETNEIITQHGDMPVKPIKYDWQVFDFERGVNEKDEFLVPIIPTVVRSPRAPPVMPITPRLAGTTDQLMFQVPVFFDLELPGRGFYRAWEFYDYFIDTSFATNKPPSLAWTRNGPNPPFINSDCGVMHFHAYRVNAFDELPEAVQSLVEKNYTLFRTPPTDMEEIDRSILEANNGVSF